MTTVEYLKQFRTIDVEIENLRDIATKQETIERLWSQATKTTSSLNAMHVTTSHSNDKQADIVAKIVDLEAEMPAESVKLGETLKQEVTRLIKLKSTIISQISQVRNHNYRNLLFGRYLSGKTWQKIAEDLGKSVQCITDKGGMHDRAIRAFESVLREEQK